jgi:hypothetical protein
VDGYSLAWELPGGLAGSADVRAVDQSAEGMGILCPEEIPIGQRVYIQASDFPGRAASVRHCTLFGDQYHIGLEFCHEESCGFQRQTLQEEVDHYEVLQINPKADLNTIHRVFRLMATRFHPDNLETGNLETFLRMKRAYEVLSDPEQRAKYDAAREKEDAGPLPVFELRDFVDGVRGEVNRRLGVLCLLYNRRRTDADHPGVSLLDLEKQMGFPRELLSFAMWYLRSKNFVTLADNSDYALTAEGADFVESNASDCEPLSKLITSGFWAPPKPQSSEMPPQRLLASAAVVV